MDVNGEAVIAGRAAAGSSLELLVNGQVHDRTTADSSGAFVFVPKPLPPGNYDISLRATTPDGKVMVSNRSVVATLRSKDGLPVAPPAAPDVRTAGPPEAPPSAAVVPHSPPASPQTKPPAEVASRLTSKDGEIRIEAIEPEEGGGLFVSGRAAPGSRVRLYMNDGYIAMCTTSPEGRVSFSIRSGVRPGNYRIRLDQMSASNSVVSRVEVPFRAPTTLAASAPPAPPQMLASPPESVAPQQPVPEPALAASIASPAQTRGVMNEKPALSPATSESSPSLPASAGPRPKALASGSVNEPPTRSAGPVPNGPSPVAPAQQAKSQASSEPVQAATPPAAKPDTLTAQRDKKDVQSPEISEPKSEPKADNNSAPRITLPISDRHDAIVIPSIDTRLIVRGDNLWRISQATYGFGQRYTVIFGANHDKIRDPDLIYPGQMFVLPSALPKQ